MSGKMCAVAGCDEARAGVSRRWCRPHWSAYGDSPELARVVATWGELPEALWDAMDATARADFTRRVSLEEQRDRETREGEQR